MTTHINDGGTWRQLTNVYINDAGIWRELSSIHINDAGTWRTVFASTKFSGSLVEGADGAFTGFVTGILGLEIGSLSPSSIDTFSISALYYYGDTGQTALVIEGAGAASLPDDYFYQLGVDGTWIDAADASISSGSDLKQWTWAGNPFSFDGSGTRAVTIR